nr:MAG TPA: hypothetical protein [Caudoviricetes sp.]
MNYELPKSIDVNGRNYEIRTDYRVILDIFFVLADVELDNCEKGFVILSMFYPEFAEMPPDDCQEAIRKCFWFINCGEEEHSCRNHMKLVDWEQDLKYIIAPINRILSQEIRSIPYDVRHNSGGLHWWTFMSAYYEIGGDCTFSEIVRIRDKKARGKKLDKNEQEWYRKNRDLVDIRKKYSMSDENLLKQWGGG